VRGLLDSDRPLRRFFDGESTELPPFYTEQVRRDLGPWWHSLPDGALRHDQNAYLRAHGGAQPAHAPIALRRAPGSETAAPGLEGWSPRPAEATE
jgi:hypothetical protein